MRAFTSTALGGLATFSRLAALLGLAALTLGLLAGGCGPRRAEPPLRSLVLVTIDTLRADHVGAYGYPRETTPFLDRLAAEGVLFENAVSASSHTAPSHASMMTSQQPFQHGLLENGHPLPPGNRTLADLVAASGYETAAFTSVGFLVELGQGFDHFDAAWRPGDATVEAALAWLAARPEEAPPFFLWVHLYDPHKMPGPRQRLQEDVERLRLETPEERRRYVDYLLARGLTPGFYPDEETILDRHVVYDAGIRFADRQVERLHQRVAETAPEARWIVTSDHGEGLGNHAYDDHGRYLYDEQIRVPLIVIGAGGPPRRVRRMVRLVDLLPTVAAWLGLPLNGLPPGSVQGYDLFGDTEREGDLSPRLAFAERRPKDEARNRRRWEDGEVYALRGGGFKYIYRSEGADELYDLAADPFELDDRAGRSPERVAALRAALVAYLEAAASGRERGPAGDEEAAKHLEELKALGYL